MSGSGGLGFVLGLCIGVFLAGWIGFQMADTSLKREAVEAGVAEFIVVDKVYGHTKFFWKTNLTEIQTLRD